MAGAWLTPMGTIALQSIRKKPHHGQEYEPHTYEESNSTRVASRVGRSLKEFTPMEEMSLNS